MAAASGSSVFVDAMETDAHDFLFFSGLNFFSM